MSRNGSFQGLDSATLNRALAGVRAPQVAAAHQAHLRHDASVAGRRRAAKSATVAAPPRPHFQLGALARPRPSAGGAPTAPGSSGSTG
ncbi:hypothetical protein [Frankia nepalensis]|uniref:hypothetical protein n=1 Tax=Frankia nepalensis TaxID=1836974 RepID=UPI001EE3DBA5|nr:hypothetical protein [Frankia nepalensis]